MDHTEELREVLQDTFDRGGNVVIPAFAVGRTQELLYFMRKIKQENLIKGHPDFEVWVDSPLAVEATEVFRNNLIACFDDETQELVRQGINPIGFNGLKISITAEDSRSINFMPQPKVIISAAGMCDAGRIRHHLKHNLWRADSTVVFAGYQAEGTLGRLLQDGADTVKIFGETIEVRSRIATLEGISGHADEDGLVKWITSFYKQKPSQVFVVHGEDTVASGFAEMLHEKYGFSAKAPFSGSVFDLAEGKWIRETEGIPISKEIQIQKRENGVYVRSAGSVQRLLKIVREQRGYSEQGSAKMADQIDASGGMELIYGYR